MTHIQRYIGAGYEVARLSDFSDLTPGRLFRTETFEGRGNLAARFKDMFVLRVTRRGPGFEKEVAELERLTDGVPCVLAPRFVQFLLVVSVRVPNTIVQSGPLYKCKITDEVLLPPSRLMAEFGGLEQLKWKDETNIVPRQAPTAIVDALAEAALISHETASFVKMTAEKPAR